MIYYLYDGTFPGLLTALYEAFYSSKAPDKILRKTDYKDNLFAEKVNIRTDQNKADKVYNAIKKKISSPSLKIVYYSFLSELKDVEILIYYYLKLGFKMGSKVENYIIDEKILKLVQVRDKVARERHRLLGLIRFRKLNKQLFYAPIEPDYNIVTLLAPHFSSRLPDQNWIIHDLKREIAVIYNQREWVLTGLSKREVMYDQEELFYQDLWREFFNSIVIKNRKNSSLQRQFMPKRYWKYLIEKK